MMATKRNLKNLGRRGLSLFMAMVMTLSLIQISAFADAPEYGLEAGQISAFTSNDLLAKLPDAPEGTYWDDPVAAPDKTQAAICGIEEHAHDVNCAATPITDVEFDETDPDQYSEDVYTYYKLSCGKEENHEHDRDCYGTRVGAPPSMPQHPEDGDTYTATDGMYAGSVYMYKNTGNPITDGWHALDCRKETGHSHTPEGCYTTEGATADDNDRAEQTGTNYYQYVIASHAHEDGCYPSSYTWTLKAYAVTSVTISDKNLVSGGYLEAVVDGQALSYQWYKNGTAIEGATDKTLNAFDTEHNAVVTAPHKYTVKAFVYGDTTGTSSGAYTAKYYTSIQNGSFETPGGWESYVQLPNGFDGLYWKSTGEDKQIELFPEKSSWHFPGRDNVASIPDGKQAAEVNAEAYGALYQDVLTEPGSTLKWSFAHRGRNGTDTLALVIVSAENSIDINDFKHVPQAYIQVTARSINTEWSTHAGNYIVPAGQYVTRFYFVAVEAAGGATQGNLLDAVTFSTTPPVTPELYDYAINYYVDDVWRKDQTGSATEGATVLPSHLEDYDGLYDAKKDYTNASLTVSASGKNVLDLYFTTPSYTIEYFTKGNGAADYTQVTDADILAGLTTTGKATYGASVALANSVPGSLTIGGDSYEKTKIEPGSLTMTKGGENVFQVYYDYVAPDYKTIHYAWTNDSVLPAGESKTFVSDTEILDLAGYEAKHTIPTFEDTARYTYATSGWYIDAAHATLYDPALHALNDGDTLYAHCLRSTVNTYSVSYAWVTAADHKAPDNAALPTTQNNLTLDGLQAISVTDLTGLPEGYTFRGWYDGPDPTTGTKVTSLSEATSSITLYAYITYNAPTRTYSVVYEYYTSENGAAASKVGEYTAVDKESVTQAACPDLDAAYAKAPGSSDYESKAYSKGTADTDKAETGSWAGNDLVYTIKYYRSNWTMGSLNLVKAISGLDDDSKAEMTSALTFTVIGPNDYSRTIKYAELTETTKGNPSLTLTGLVPGTYTVVENNATTGTSGYTLSASANDADAETNGYQVEVSAQAAPATMTITNAYTSKTYNIFFDGGAHAGVVNSSNGAVPGIYRERVQEIQDRGYAWSGSLRTPGQTLYGIGLNGDDTIYPNLTENPAIGKDVNMKMYTFTYADYLAHTKVMDIAVPKLDVDPEFVSDGHFYNGNTAFTNIADAIAKMNEAEPDVNGFYNITYVATQTAKSDLDYGFTVEYYRDSIAEENRLGGNEASAPYGTVLDEVNVGTFLNDSSWLNAQRPAGYNRTNATYVTVRDDAAANVVNVVYTRVNEGGGTTTNYYYQVNTQYTAYDAEGNEIYSDSVTGAVQSTGSSTYTLTSADTATRGNYTFALTSAQSQAGNLSGTSRTNPYVFTVTYEFTEIGDTDTPTGELPTDPTETTEPTDPADPTDTGEMDIIDEEVPLAEVPNTGDSLMLWIMAAAVSGMSLVWLVLSGKKRKDEEV